MIELRLLPPLVVFEVNVLLGAFALLQARVDRRHRFFAAFALAAGLWCLGSMLYFILPQNLRELGLRAGFAGVTIVPAVFMAFGFFISGRALPRSTLFNAALAVILMNVIANLDRLMLLSPEGLMIVSAFQLIAALLYFAGFYVTAFLELRAALKTGERREEARFILYASTAPFVLMLLYALFTVRFERLPLANLQLPVALTAELMLYYAVRFKKVEVEVLSRGVLYLVYAVALTGVIFIAIYLASRLFDFSVSAPAFVALVAFCLISAYGFMASRGRIQAWVDREFFPEKIEYQEKLAAYERELDESRERLQAAERLALIGELAAKVAHEIKNPLGPIKGYTQMLREARQRGDLPAEKLDKALAIIAEEADHIDARVKSLLDLARAQPLQRSPVDLHDLINQTLALLEERPRLAIVRDLRAASPVLSLDPSRFQGALYNLFINAVQAMNAKGTLRVSTENQGDAVIINVSDTGPGIPLSLLPLVFEPFHSTRPAGTGLGLAIARSVIEAHGGRIEAENGEEGGARFRVVMGTGVLLTQMNTDGGG